MAEKITNTFRILPETDRKLKEICEMIQPRSNQGDVIDWLVGLKYDELTAKKPVTVEEELERR